ncbi:nucleotide exchange factor GrpE [Pseudonocardia sp. GCM10023141]|uniref:nucleotide exchange factor GrpE n=1 Tax=Pseudonocardia sp. GCM10023141 TaxID=3252653 RepID=UPI003623B3DB
MPDPTLQEIADKVDDVARMLTRQAATLGRLAEPKAVVDTPDGPLLVELHALLVDTLTCAGTARTRRERQAFEAIGAGLDRLLAGRGATVVAPAAGEPFSGTTMEAVEVVATADPEQDRTVAELLIPGLLVGGRSLRPARVAVRRHRPT